MLVAYHHCATPPISAHDGSLGYFAWYVDALSARSCYSPCMPSYLTVSAARSARFWAARRHILQTIASIGTAAAVARHYACTGPRPPAAAGTTRQLLAHCLGLPRLWPEPAVAAAEPIRHWLLLPTVDVLAVVVTSLLRQGMSRQRLQELLKGRYQQPEAENRVFLFVDLKDSTHLAKTLGNDQYRRLVRDFFRDVSPAIAATRGEVYQYVGDEVVVTWPSATGLTFANCLHCFFAMQCAIGERHAAYQRAYGVVPSFKAGARGGQVTTVLVGTQHPGPVQCAGQPIPPLCRVAPPAGRPAGSSAYCPGRANAAWKSRRNGPLRCAALPACFGLTRWPCSGIRSELLAVMLPGCPGFAPVFVSTPPWIGFARRSGSGQTAF